MWTVHHTQILRNYIEDLLHPLGFSETLDAWNEVSWGIWARDCCWEIINFPNHILTSVLKHMHINMCLKIFLLLSPDSYYHYGRKQSQKTGRLCLQTVGWKKAFYKTLSVNIPNSALQCLQTPVTQDGRDESLRQVQFNQKTSLHPAMHTVPQCHSTHTLCMAVCHHHSTLHTLPLETRGIQVTQTSHSLSSEINLELQAVDNLTQKRQSMGMNTVI